MITYTNLNARAVEIRVEGRVTPADMRDAFARFESLLAAAPKLDVLADVAEGTHVELAAIGEELKHLGAMSRMVGALERVALVADPAWVRAIGRVESWLIPGIDYRVYDRDGAAKARAFVLRADELSGG